MREAGPKFVAHLGHHAGKPGGTVSLRPTETLAVLFRFFCISVSLLDYCGRLDPFCVCQSSCVLSVRCWVRGLIVAIAWLPTAPRPHPSVGLPRWGQNDSLIGVSRKLTSPELWLSPHSALSQVEILTWVKFFPAPLMNASSPDDVKMPWLATLSLFSLWGLLFFAVSEETGGGPTAASDSSYSITSLDECVASGVCEKDMSSHGVSVVTTSEGRPQRRAR